MEQPTMGANPQVVILTGAGISAESGIRTFRDAGGLWGSYRVEDVATPEAWRRDRALVQRFYNDRRDQLLDGSITPNKAHRALAKLEAHLGENVLIVTQNIDNLHELAGSRNVIYMHGELLKARCVRSGQVVGIQRRMATNEPCNCCNPSTVLRPHVVWFGEIPLAMDDIHTALSRCEFFISIGTSGSVYPAAGFVDMAHRAGAHTLELNLEPSQTVSAFHEHRQGPASTLVPTWVEEHLGLYA